MSNLMNTNSNIWLLACLSLCRRLIAGCIPLLFLVVTPAMALNQNVVEVAQGKLLGETVGANHDVRVFKAIPYALPPIGDRRWRPPEAALPWPGTRMATAFGPACAQPLLAKNGALAEIPLPVTSEDCLNLNVWTTA